MRREEREEWRVESWERDGVERTRRGRVVVVKRAKRVLREGLGGRRGADEELEEAWRAGMSWYGEEGGRGRYLRYELAL